MKNKLLAAMTLCCATSMSAWAGDWGTPQLAFVDPDLTIPTDEIPTTNFKYLRNLGDYYIYHVATGKFLTNGNAYGTQLSIGTTGQRISMAYGYDRVLYDADNYTATGWVITMPDAPSNSGDGAIYHETYISSQTLAYVDGGVGNGIGHMLWNITRQDDGNYRITVIDEDPLYGSASEYVGCYMARITDGDPETTVIIPLANPANMTLEADWRFVSVEAYNAFQAKTGLAEALDAAEEKGLTEADYGSFLDIYNSATATAEEVEQATLDLQRTITEKVAEGASVQNPVDVTFNLPGANCNSLDGWNVVSTPVNVMTNGESWAGLGADTFLEPCNWGATGWTGEFNRTIAVPDGMYRLTAFGRRSAGSTLTIYANDAKVSTFPEASRGGTIDIHGNVWPSFEEGVANGAEFATVDGEQVGYGWEQRIVEVTVTDGTLTIGCKGESAGLHEWCSIDEFRLYYMGKADLDYVISTLNATIQEAEQTKNEAVAGNASFSVAGGEALDADVQRAKDLINNPSATESELREMLAALQERIEAFEYDVKVYNELLPTQIEAIDELLLKNEDLFEYLTGTIAYEEELMNAFEEKTFDPANYEGIAAEVDRIFKEDISRAIVGGQLTDITPLITNADYSNGATGWNGDPAIEYEVAEKYNTGSADVYQELTGLPAGTYEISVDGFYRPGGYADSGTNYSPEGDDYNAINAYVYGNSVQKPLMHMFEGLLDEQPTEVDNFVQLSIPNAPELDGKWGPNMRVAANYAINSVGKYKGNTVTCGVGDDGVLRFGIKVTANPNGSNWTVFDNWKITYKGADNVEGFKVELNDVLTSAKELYKSEDVKATEDATKLNTLIIQIELAMDGYTTRDQFTNAKEQLNAQMEVVQKGIDLIKEAYGQAVIFAEAYENGQYNDYDAVLLDEFVLAYEDVKYGYDDKAFTTYEEVEGLQTAMFEAYATMIMDGVSGSVESPADVTALIQNPSFTDATGTASTVGWNLDGKGALQSGENQGNCVEVYDKTTFDVNQTLYSLKPGWYILKMQGFYRYGGDGIGVAATARKEGTDDIKAFLYATPSDQQGGALKLCSIFDGIITEIGNAPGRDGSDQLLTADQKLDSDADYCYVPNAPAGACARFNIDLYWNEIAFEVTADTRSVRFGVKEDEGVSKDWTVFDNFQLYYTGTEKPNVATAIEGVEASTADVVSTVYYTIGGVRIEKPAQSGLYIREDLLSDGTKKVTKVLVK